MVAGTVCYLEVMKDAGRLGPSYVPYGVKSEAQLRVKSTIKANRNFPSEFYFESLTY